MNIQKNINLKKYNTFQVENITKFFIIVKSENDLISILKTDEFKENKYFVLGGGANTLFTKDFDGIVIKNEISGIQKVQENQNEVIIKVGAGENRDDFVNYCLENNFGGVENLIYIPGTVGASPVQNIGAYGCEAKDTILEIQGINIENGKKQTLTNKECRFTYRDSIFKNELKDKFIITYVIFKLKKTDQTYKINIEYKGILDQIQSEGLSKETISIQDLARIIKEIRQSKLPDHKKIPTAGSFFQNPIIKKESFDELQKKYENLVSYPINEQEVKLAAGQLIELAGLKGFESNGVATHKNHALVLINTGTKKGEDIIKFAKYIQKMVFEKFGIHIQAEVNIL